MDELRDGWRLVQVHEPLWPGGRLQDLFVLEKDGRRVMPPRRAVSQAQRRGIVTIKDGQMLGGLTPIEWIEVKREAKK
jgi:hypothetical protein